MIEAVLVTLLPAGFLVVLFGGGALFRKKNIGQDGEAPINRTLFYASKYSILVLWGAMVIRSWGISISFVEVPRFLQLIALLLWISGFVLLYLGRFKMGDSFRLGTPKRRYQPQEGWIIPVEQEPDVRGRVCNDRRVLPLHPEPDSCSAGSVRDCHPPYHRPGRGGTYAKSVWPEISGLL